MRGPATPCGGGVSLFLNDFGIGFFGLLSNFFLKTKTKRKPRAFKNVFYKMISPFPQSIIVFNILNYAVQA